MILSENPINMNLKTIEQLLQNAQIILQKDKAEKKEHEARGEYFNVLKIYTLRVQRSICIHLSYGCFLIRMPIMV